MLKKLKVFNVEWDGGRHETWVSDGKKVIVASGKCNQRAVRPMALELVNGGGIECFFFASDLDSAKGYSEYELQACKRQIWVCEHDGDVLFRVKYLCVRQGGQVFSFAGYNSFMNVKGTFAGSVQRAVLEYDIPGELAGEAGVVSHKDLVGKHVEYTNFKSVWTFGVSVRELARGGE